MIFTKCCKYSYRT